MTDDDLAAADWHNRIYAAHVLIRASVARDTYTMERVLARWASETQGGDFSAALAGAASGLALLLADRDEARALEAADRLVEFNAQRHIPGAARAA
jgi:hypothetical protein